MRCPGLIAMQPRPSARSAHAGKAGCGSLAVGGAFGNALVFDEEFPLVDSPVDRILLVHRSNIPKILADAERNLARSVACPAGSSSSSRTVAASGQGSNIRRSALGDRFRAVSSTPCCARPILRLRHGPTRCFFRLRNDAGCCGFHPRWSAWAAGSGRSSRVSLWSRRKSGFFRHFLPRSGPRAGSSCRF